MSKSGCVEEWLVGCSVSSLIGGGQLDTSTLMNHLSGVRQYRSVATFFWTCRPLEVSAMSAMSLYLSGVATSQQ